MNKNNTRWILFIILCVATYWNAATYLVSMNDFTQALYLGAAILSGLWAASIAGVAILEEYF